MTTKMKCFAIYLPLMIMVLALSGCGTPQEQYDQSTPELTSFQQQLEELNTRVEDLTKTNRELENSFNNSTKLNEGVTACSNSSHYISHKPIPSRRSTNQSHIAEPSFISQLAHPHKLVVRQTQVMSFVCVKCVNDKLNFDFEPTLQNL